MLIPVPYGSIGCTYQQLKYSSPYSSKKQEPHKSAYLLRNGGLRKKRSGQWANSRKRKDRKSDRTRQKNKRGDIYIRIKVTALRFQTGGRHQKSPGFPSGIFTLSSTHLQQASKL